MISRREEIKERIKLLVSEAKLAVIKANRLRLIAAQEMEVVEAKVEKMGEELARLLDELANGSET